MRVTGHLRSRFAGEADAGRRVLQLIATRDGAGWHVDAEGGYWRAYSFIEGARTLDAVGSARQAFEAARAFGEFQRCSRICRRRGCTRAFRIFTTRRSGLLRLSRLWARIAAGLCSAAQSEIEFAMARKTLARVLLEAGLPERVTHNDTKLNNVLLDDATGEGLCVIDLDTVMPGLAAYDFGDMVRTMTCAAAGGRA